jgi:sterol desaturase/sphingolipid hydroxylase (fatty acid hydroxylase superfamily)
MALADLPTTLPGALREFARHGSPRILMALAAGCAAARLLLGDFAPADLAIAAGIAALWPLQEWCIHVFILHYRPVSVFGRRWDFTVPQMHRAHHRDPWRLDLVFIPLQVYLYTPAAIAAALWLSPATLPRIATFLAAYFALSLHYEWVHYLVHTRYRPRSRLYARLWRNHRRHHFKNEHYWFGVTMLSGDRLLGTGPDTGDVPTSPTARTLGEEALY